MYFPIELKETFELQETIEEISFATMEGFKSKYDDAADTISQLASLVPWKPSPTILIKQDPADDIWYEEVDEQISNMESYIV